MYEINETIDQSLDYMADGFSYTTPYIDSFLAGNNTVVIEQGFNTKSITTIHGQVDSWEISADSKSLTVQVSGRDAVKTAKEYWFVHTYFLDKPETEPIDEFGDPLNYTVGSITAKEVAEAACTAAGLKLTWDCLDYPVVNEVKPNAGYNCTVAELLKKLTEPLSMTEMHKVDVYGEGESDIIVRKRKYPYAAEQQISLAGDYVKTVNIKRTNWKPRQVRNIILFREEPEKKSNGLGELEREEEFINEIRNSYGTVIRREIITNHYQLTKLVSQHKVIFEMLYSKKGTTNELDMLGLDLMEDTTIIYDFGLIFDRNTPLQRKLETSDFYAQGGDYAGYTFKRRHAEGVSIMKYDGAGNLSVEDETKTWRTYTGYGSQIFETITDKNDPDYGKPAQFTERTVKGYEYIGNNILETTVQKFTNGNFISKETQQSYGQMPGPKQVAPTKNIFTMNIWKQKILCGANGEDVKIDNPLLSREIMQQLADEIKQEQSMTKYEIELNILPMPWLKKGRGLQVTGTLNDGKQPAANILPLAVYQWMTTKITYRKTGKEWTCNVGGIAWVV